MNTIPDCVFGYDFGLTLSDRWCHYNHTDPFIYSRFSEKETNKWEMSLIDIDILNHERGFVTQEKELWRKTVNSL